MQMGGQGQGHQAGPGFLAGEPEVQARRWGEGQKEVISVIGPIVTP